MKVPGSNQGLRVGSNGFAWQGITVDRAVETDDGSKVITVTSDTVIEVVVGVDGEVTVTRDGKAMAVPKPAAKKPAAKKPAASKKKAAAKKGT